MPHFMLQMTPNGPIVQAAILVSAARREALESSGIPIPTAQRIVALIDTGASVSVVDPSVLAALDLNPTGDLDIHTPSTEGISVKASTYDVQFGIYAIRPGDPHFVSETVQVASAVLANQGIHALIGRDILASCVLIYNGADGYFTLAY